MPEAGTRSTVQRFAGVERLEQRHLLDTFVAVIRVAGTQRHGCVIHHFGAELSRFAVYGQQPVADLHGQYGILLIVHAQRAETQRIEGRQVAVTDAS